MKKPSKKPSRTERDNLDVKYIEKFSDQFLANLASTTRRGLADDVGEYMQVFQPFPTLTKQEDYDDLFHIYQTGTALQKERARDLITYGNAKLVCRVAMRYFGRGMPIEDLCQEGFIGLLRAIEKFDLGLGYRFSTYAIWSIRQAMVRVLITQNEHPFCHTPVHYSDSLHIIRKALQQLYLQLGQPPTILQVYEYLQSGEIKVGRLLRKNGIKLTDVALLYQAVTLGKVKHLELDAPLNEGYIGETQADHFSIGPPKTETLIEARRLYIEYHQAVQRIEQGIDSLDQRSATIVKLRLGLGDFDLMTLDEIGNRYDITRERVRQIEVKAWKTLEQTLNVTRDEVVEIIEVMQDLEVVAHAI